MLIKILKITKGIADIDLGEYNIREFSLRNVTFHTDEPEYKVKLRKYGRYKSKKLKITNKLYADPIYYFTLYRDGFTGLELVASCDGTFIFEFDKCNPCSNKNAIDIQYDIMVANARYKHYSQYFKICDDVISINEIRFKNYTYFKYEKEIMELRLAHAKTIGHNKSYISRKYDVLFGLEISSTANTKCVLYVNHTDMLAIDIKEGRHYYPIFLIICALYFCSIEIKFDEECIDNIIEYGTILDADTLLLFKSKRIILHNENGMICDYKNGLLTIN